MVKTIVKKNKFGKYSKSKALIELGERIRKYRKENIGLSQEVFANSVGLHRTYLSSIERGEFNMTIMTLLLLSKGLKVKLDDLIHGLDKSNVEITNA